MKRLREKSNEASAVWHRGGSTAHQRGAPPCTSAEQRLRCCNVAVLPLCRRCCCHAKVEQEGSQRRRSVAHEYEKFRALAEGNIQKIKEWKQNETKHNEKSQFRNQTSHTPRISWSGMHSTMFRQHCKIFASFADPVAFMQRLLTRTIKHRFRWRLLLSRHFLIEFLVERRERPRVRSLWSGSAALGQSTAGSWEHGGSQRRWSLASTFHWPIDGLTEWSSKWWHVEFLHAAYANHATMLPAMCRVTGCQRTHGQQLWVATVIFFHFLRDQCLDCSPTHGRPNKPA